MCNSVIIKLASKLCISDIYLSRFDFTLKHVSETKIGKVDELSRKLDWKVRIKKNNDNQVFIKDC